MAKDIKFTKWHGLGNDFIIVDDRSGRTKFSTRQVLAMGSRNYGIGFDQMMVVRKPGVKAKKAGADFRMELYNNDGSIAEMCGNGIRCFAMFIKTRKISKKKELAIETGAGLVRTKIIGNMVEVDMGEPVLDAEDVPMNRTGSVVNEPLNTREGFFNVTAVSMGNPHAVVFVRDVQAVELEKVGPLLETNSAFPNRTNVEFAQVISRESIDLRVWERGAGATLACGTGACATAVAAVLNKLTGRRVEVNLPGGRLVVKWDEVTNHVFMTGPTAEVFSGLIKI
jgi:diaminopimelate epimerase